MVRKNPHRWVKGEPAWRAWTTGKLKPFSRWFHTQQEAIEWATWCARTRQQLPPDQAEQAIREGKKWGEYYQKFIRPKTVV